MSWTCNLSRSAERQLVRLPRVMQQRIARSIDELEHDPLEGDVRPLRGEWQGWYRKRVGRYRIIFEIDRERRCVDIAAILPRTDRTY